MIPPKLIALIIKELLSAFKDPKTRIAFVIPPLMQVFLYGYAATLEVTNVPIAVYNEDWGQSSRQLVERFERASAFSKILYLNSDAEVRNAIDSQQVLIAVHIGQDFSRKLAAKEQAPVQIILDGRRSNSAQILNGYLATILNQFSVDYTLGESAPPAVSEAVVPS